jgi:antitoxin HicB
VSDKDPMTTRYTVLIYPDDGAYSVTVPALPGCVTWGATLDEAVASAHEAIEGHIAALRDTGQDVPEEDASRSSSPSSRAPRPTRCRRDSSMNGGMTLDGQTVKVAADLDKLRWLALKVSNTAT